jgi:alpha-mannosidase
MPTRTEADVLREILPAALYNQIPGIIQGTTRLALLMQSSHLDYDWLGTFWQYLRYGVGGRDYPTMTADRAVQSILDNATKLVSKPGFTFSIAEMRFLQEAIAHNPSLQASLQSAGARFDIIGASVETPDALLPPGEAYIRCYLQGYLWASRAFPNTDLLTCAWLPDSFGFCSSLPILYNAMGIGAVGLTRFPGSSMQDPENGALASYLYAQKKIDFLWNGADGVPLLVHWMQNGYNQGFTSLSTLNTRLTGGKWDGNATVAPTQYCLVPIGDDLACPDPDLATLVNQWNNAPLVPNQLVAAGTVAQYIELLGFHQNKIQTVDLRTYPPSPYWVGFYGMHPAIKQLMRRGTMAALAAEAFGALAMLAPNVFGTSELQPTIDAAWGSLAVGTSHNILTGCAEDLTTYAEQRPLLEMGCGGAENTRDVVVNTLAQATWSQPYSGSAWPVVVFQQNSVSAGTAALAEYVPDPALGIDLSSVTSVSFSNPNVATPVQQSADQTLLFKAAVPALGYQQGTLTTTPANNWLGELVFGTVAPGRFFLQNQFLRAEIGDDGRVLTLQDRQKQVNLLSGVGNDLVFYTDTGNVYRFGNERANVAGWDFTRLNPVWSAAARTVLETGPVRLRVRCEATATVNGAPYTYVREYSLIAGEPFLRVSTSGVAPENTSVFANVPFANTNGVQYGTMAHWDNLLPTPPDSSTWTPPYFFVAHDFVIATANGNPAAAVYHECMPCWSLFNGGLLACLARNPSAYQTAYGAAGTDFDRFTQVYALRVGSGLQPAASGKPLMEARTFNAPTQTRVPRPIVAWTWMGQGNGTPSLNPQYSLASITQGTAYITAAKVRSGAPPEDLILRIYTPTPKQQIQVTLGGSPRADDSTMKINTVGEVTALELPVTPGIPINISGALVFTFTPTRCLTTVAVTFASTGGSDAHMCS